MTAMDLTENPATQEKVSGWLAFFLFLFMFSPVLSLLYHLTAVDVSEYGDFEWAYYIDLLVYVFFEVLGVYTLVAFIRRKPDAVFMAKSIAVLFLISNIMTFFTGDFAESGVGSPINRVISIGWSIVYFCYFSFSDKVKDLIPEETRKVTWKNWLIVAVVPVLWLSVFFITFFLLLLAA